MIDYKLKYLKYKLKYEKFLIGGMEATPEDVGGWIKITIGKNTGDAQVLSESEDGKSWVTTRGFVKKIKDFTYDLNKPIRFFYTGGPGNVKNFLTELKGQRSRTLSGELAEYYKRQFLDLGTNIKLPKVISGATSSWAQFTIRLPLNCDRENFQIKMKEKGIPTAIYYPIPIHCQKPYKKFPISSDKLNNTNLLSKCVISLPMHAYLSFEDIEYISKAAHDIINN